MLKSSSIALTDVSLLIYIVFPLIEQRNPGQTQTLQSTIPMCAVESPVLCLNKVSMICVRAVVPSTVLLAFLNTESALLNELSKVCKY